jgi:hypothetical protein
MNDIQSTLIFMSCAFTVPLQNYQRNNRDIEISMPFFFLFFFFIYSGGLCELNVKVFQSVGAWAFETSLEEGEGPYLCERS